MKTHIIIASLFALAFTVGCGKQPHGKRQTTFDKVDLDWCQIAETQNSHAFTSQMGDIVVIGVDYPKQMNRWACLKTDSQFRIKVLSELSKTCVFVASHKDWDDRLYIESKSFPSHANTPTVDYGRFFPSRSTWIVVECGKIQIERMK